MVERLAPLFNSRYFFRLVAIAYMTAGLLLALLIQAAMQFAIRAQVVMLNRAPRAAYAAEERMVMTIAVALFATGLLLFPFGFAMDRNFRGRASGWIATGHLLMWCALVMFHPSSLVWEQLFPLSLSFVEQILLAVAAAFAWFWMFPDHDFRNPVGSLPWSGGGLQELSL